MKRHIHKARRGMFKPGLNKCWEHVEVETDEVVNPSREEHSKILLGCSSWVATRIDYKGLE